jgi:hypothetical protein
MHLRIHTGLIIACLPICLLVGMYQSYAQDIVRLEIDGSDLELPFYTMTAGEQGLLVMHGTEVKGRRISSWELIHYDVGLREVHKFRFTPDQGFDFAGWQVGEQVLHLLFLRPGQDFAGEVLLYHFGQHTHKRIPFSMPGIRIPDPSFRVSGEVTYLAGMNRASQKPAGLLRGKQKGGQAQSELVILTYGGYTADSMQTNRFSMSGTSTLVKVQTAKETDGLLMLLSSGSGRYKLVGFSTLHPVLIGKGALNITSGHTLSDYNIVRTDSFPLALAGTYSNPVKRSGSNEAEVYADGLFFASLDTTSGTPVRYYPFSAFSNLPEGQPRDLSRASRTQNRDKQRGNQTYRVLLHETPYLVNGNLLLVGETYYPEYEYDSRSQSFAIPYSYYGYYPGFYDMGGRWVFLGFRYEKGLVAAFDQGGNLVWENGFATTNMLDKNLTTRLNLLAYGDELVMVYAHEGRIWFRVIREDEVLVDKENYPVELPSVSDRVKEHYGMNMTRWYDRYFLVWGRQSIRSLDGRTRTVYYCNKLAFE